ncbi:MAG: PQQ-binding-like beta-propeller repeat protein [Candidatus Bathyarchaeota archaeon]|nr:PQQ-binding-like beta-propeller repeat protein [Candidatus Bathyarchaeota archaeon]
MGNKHEHVFKTSAIIAVLLLVFSTFVLLSNSVGTAKAQTSDVDLMQYEWTQLGATGDWTLYSDGPAPNRPSVAWTQPITGLPPFAFAATVTAFGGFVFGLSLTTLYAYDPFTGQIRWTYTQANGNFQSSPTKIDDTYLFLDGGSGAGGLGYVPTPGELTNATVTVLRIADGTFVSNFTVVGVGFQPGAGGYFPGRYSPETHMKYVRGYDAQTNEASYYAIDLTDPTNPSLGWHTVLDETGEDLSVGGGILLVGTVNGAVLGLNATTGDIIWRSQKIGFAQYTATYVDGMFIQGSASTRLTAYNATNGEIIWDKEQGGRAFFAFAGATGYGRFYQHNIALPSGFIGCWDTKTGELLWKQIALYQIGYITPVLADGKLYIQQYSGTAGGVEAQTSTFSCFDAFTGDLLWAMPDTSITNPSVAYGNLYGIKSGYLYCFSDVNPEPWSMWRGNTATPGVVQGTGPLCLAPEWSFTTEGPITSSPAAVNGKVYFGSQDGNIYCIDAYDGTPIWNFTTQHRVYSSPAVVGDRVFTGADDGSIHALNAETGELIWTTPAGGLTDYVFAATWQPRSSPIVVGNRLYVGALDGKLYCLDTSDGTPFWTRALGNETFPIAGSAAYSDGYIYIDCTNHNLYKIDATSGNIIWVTTSNATISRAYTNFFPWSTPVVFNNTVYWGAGPVYGLLIWYALDATTGQQIWNVTNNRDQTPDADYRFLGNTPTCQTPVLVPWNDSISVMIVGENLGVSIRNANSGERIYYQFLGHEVYSSACYVNDSRGPKFYIGSDTYAITCFNMTAAMINDAANSVLSVYTTGSHIQASPTVWAGMLYVASADAKLYMFKDRAQNQFSIFAESNKGNSMWTNQTLEIAGRLTPAATIPTADLPGYGSLSANGVPNATIYLSFVKPDGTSENLTTSTDYLGNFVFTYNPAEVGEWNWLVYYYGEMKPAITYTAACTEYTALSVTLPPGEPTPTPTPTGTSSPSVTSTPTSEPTSTSTENSGGGNLDMIYVAIAVVVIVVVIVGAYAYSRRGKNP